MDDGLDDGHMGYDIEADPVLEDEGDDYPDWMRNPREDNVLEEEGFIVIEDEDGLLRLA